MVCRGVEAEVGLGEVCGEGDKLAAGGERDGVVDAALDEAVTEAVGCVLGGLGTGEAVYPRDRGIRGEDRGGVRA